MQREPPCWPMKSQVLALLRSTLPGLQGFVLRFMSARSFAPPALTRRSRASQLFTALFPDLLSGSFTTCCPARVKVSRRAFVSAVNFWESKVFEKAWTLWVPASRAVTFARSPFFREVWDSLRICTFGEAAEDPAPPAPIAIAVTDTNAATTADAKKSFFIPLRASLS